MTLGVLSVHIVIIWAQQLAGNWSLLVERQENMIKFGLIGIFKGTWLSWALMFPLLGSSKSVLLVGNKSVYALSRIWFTTINNQAKKWAWCLRTNPHVSLACTVRRGSFPYYHRQEQPGFDEALKIWGLLLLAILLLSQTLKQVRLHKCRAGPHVVLFHCTHVNMWRFLPEKKNHEKWKFNIWPMRATKIMERNSCTQGFQWHS